MFDTSFRITGKHANYWKDLCELAGNVPDRDQHNNFKIFNAYIDAYILCPMIGYQYNRKGVIDNTVSGEAGMMADVFKERRAQLKFVYQTLMLLDTDSEPDLEKRVYRAFTFAENTKEEKQFISDNMKIYNKNSFIEGFIMTLLGLLLFITILVTEFNIKKFLLSPLLLFMGIGLIERSISKSMSKEDKVDKNDERNQFISLKSRGKALQITQMCSWIIMLLILIIGKINNHMMLISLGTGMMIIFTISLFTELFCNIYYERIF